MTLDEAIRHAEEVAKEQDKLCRRYDDASGYTRSGNEKIRTNEAKKCAVCAEEHRMLAWWLRDYKRLKEQEPCEDAVSRKALISHIEKQSREWGEDYDAQQILGDIEDMPSVKPQEPTGHWIIMGDRYIKCSECGHITKTESPDIYNFCMVCGKRMIEPQGSEG